MRKNYIWAVIIFLLLVANVLLFLYYQDLLRSTWSRAYDQGQYDLVTGKRYTNREVWDSWAEARQVQLEVEHDQRQAEFQRQMMDWIRRKD